MPCVTFLSAAPDGGRMVPVRIEVDLQPGLPHFVIAGYADGQASGVRLRVRSAIKNSGFSFPRGRLSVSLSPADLPKRGTAYDLGIALGVLVAGGIVKPDPREAWMLGGLSLDGSLRPVGGIEAALVQAVLDGVAGCLIGLPDQAAAHCIGGCAFYAAANLKEAVGFLQDGKEYAQAPPLSSERASLAPLTYDRIRGQAAAKRAAVIAAAGNHSLFLTGPPGIGKTMLGRAVYELLPPSTGLERLEIMRTAALAGQPANGQRPWRDPHHSASAGILLGGGNPLVPGEAALAHRGVLFLDEIGEYARGARESLRQPLQDKEIRLSCRGRVVRYPACFLAVATQNPCPCGLKGLPGRRCRCTMGEVRRYAAALSESFRDRFDLFVQMGMLDPGDWETPYDNPADQPVQFEGREMRKRVIAARRCQAGRYGEGRCNADGEIETVFAGLAVEAKRSLERAVSRLRLSGRAREKLVRVARTVADLAGDRQIREEHIAEAALYRCRPSSG